MSNRTVHQLSDIPGYGREPWMLISEASRKSGISAQTIHSWIKNGKIEAYYFVDGRIWYINYHDMPSGKKAKKYNRYRWTIREK